MDGDPVSKMPVVRRYKSRTKLQAKPRVEYRRDETPNVVTMEMVERTSAKYLEQ